MKKLIPIVFALLALGYLLLPADDDPGEIGAIFDKMLAAGIKKDLDGITEHFSLLYKDEYGTTYPVLKNIVKYFYEKFDGFNGRYSNLTVSIGEDSEGKKRAVANLDVYISGIKDGRESDILGGEDSPENITVTLEKSGLQDWKILTLEGLEGFDEEY